MTHHCPVGGKARALGLQEMVDCLPQGLSGIEKDVEPNVTQDHFAGGCDGHRLSESQWYTEHQTSVCGGGGGS